MEKEYKVNVKIFKAPSSDMENIVNTWLSRNSDKLVQIEKLQYVSTNSTTDLIILTYKCKVDRYEERYEEE